MLKAFIRPKGQYNPWFVGFQSRFAFEMTAMQMWQTAATCCHARLLIMAIRRFMGSDNWPPERPLRFETRPRVTSCYSALAAVNLSRTVCRQSACYLSFSVQGTRTGAPDDALTRRGNE